MDTACNAQYVQALVDNNWCEVSVIYLNKQLLFVASLVIKLKQTFDIACIVLSSIGVAHILLWK